MGYRIQPTKLPRQVATVYDWKLGKQYLGEEEGEDKEISSIGT